MKVNIDKSELLKVVWDIISYEKPKKYNFNDPVVKARVLKRGIEESGLSKDSLTEEMIMTLIAEILLAADPIKSFDPDHCTHSRGLFYLALYAIKHDNSYLKDKTKLIIDKHEACN